MKILITFAVVLGLIFATGNFLIPRQAAILAYADETSVAKNEMIQYDNDISGNSKEYFGWAATNTATSAAAWKMMRITYTGTDFVLEWLDGGQDYTGTWDDRTTETYN